MDCVTRAPWRREGDDVVDGKHSLMYFVRRPSDAGTHRPVLPEVSFEDLLTDLCEGRRVGRLPTRVAPQPPATGPRESLAEAVVAGQAAVEGDPVTVIDAPLPVSLKYPSKAVPRSANAL